MEFYIVNEIDRPEKRLVAQLVNGMLRYVDISLRNYGEMDKTEEATNMREFGFDIIIRGDKVSFTKVRESIATYRDGIIRPWQGWQNDFIQKLIT